ncbi:hypothetical protein GALL_337870 [mine drainage metagenome]|uniref:Uncharacterized protein n=1 Tax=mine drainage metagenome TaxID=410659 RepID=A0A1J5R3S8_9ZZZZ
MQIAGTDLDAAGLSEELLAEQFAHAAGKVGRAQTLPHLAVVGQAENHLRPRQRHAPQRLFAVGELGGFLLQEFAPCRRVEVEVAGLDHRAPGEGRGRGRQLMGVYAPGVCGACGAAGD